MRPDPSLNSQSVVPMSEPSSHTCVEGAVKGQSGLSRHLMRTVGSVPSRAREIMVTYTVAPPGISLIVTTTS
jgi:hypothetical protein